MNLFLAASPVLVVAALILFFRAGVIATGIAGVLYTAVLVHLRFGTPVPVVALAAADGVITTLPIILVVCAGILLADILLGTGSLQRVGNLLTGRAAGAPRRAMVLSFGLGNILEGAGIVAEPLSAPLLRAKEFTPAESATLSILGYSGLLTLEFAGIILAVLSLATGIGIPLLAAATVRLSIAAVFFSALLLPWMVRSHAWTGRDLPPVLGAVAVLALAVALAAEYVSYALSGMIGGLALTAWIGITGRRRRPAMSGASGTPGPDREEAGLSFRDLLPYALILVPFLAAGLLPPVRAAMERAARLEIAVVPGHPVVFHPLADVYTYLFLAGIAAEGVAAGGRVKNLAALVRRSLPRGARAGAAMALFGAMGQVIAFSGFDPSFTAAAPGGNLAAVIAGGVHGLAGPLYLLFVPLLGWTGTFLTGYGVASIMLFGKLQVSLGSLLGIDPAPLAAALAVGAGVGSISSPFKVAIATPLCDGIGREPEILRKTIPAGILVSLLLGAVLFLSAGGL